LRIFQSFRMKVDACIFDMDGVIVDTAKFHYQAWKRMAQLFGGDLTEEQNEKLKGVSRRGSLDFILSENGVEKTEEEKVELANQKNVWYLELIGSLNKSELLPGVLELIKELHLHDISIALGSASKNAITILKMMGIDHYFDALVDGNSVQKSKPNPEVFLKGAKGMDIKPANCIVFEDSSKGIEAAIKGGFIPIGIGEQHNLEEALIVYPGFNQLTWASILQDLNDQMS